MNSYLYLIPFNDNAYFKIGISSGGFDRVIHHNRQFGVNLNKAVIVRGAKRIIKSIESELLMIFPKCTHNYKGDGITEIRELKYFGEAIEIIKNKDSRLNLVFEKVKKSSIPRGINIRNINALENYESFINQIFENIYHSEYITQFFDWQNINEYIWIETDRINVENILSNYKYINANVYVGENGKNGILFMFEKQSEDWQMLTILRILLRKKIKKRTTLFGEESDKNNESVLRIKNFIKSNNNDKNTR